MVPQQSQSSDSVQDVDVVIVGAGMAGLYALHHLRGLGFSCRVFDSAGGVGGTWYWNRYPGARVDIESIEYSYSFDEDLQQEWDWTERYAGQEELLRYFNYVADRFALRRDITLNTRVESAEFDEENSIWIVTTDGAGTFRGQHIVFATGFVSAPNKPNLPGLESFTGEVHHSGLWPHEGVDFTGKRVGIIGTGSSGVQMTPVIAQQAAHLSVFQRTAPFVIPLRNCPMPPEYLRSVKENYGEWRSKELLSFGGYIALNFDIGVPRSEMTTDLTDDEVIQDFEDRWRNGGICYYACFPDLFVDEQANERLADFIRAKSRERIGDDDALAEALLPFGYPVLTKRLIADTGYYEAFLRDNVNLVDVKHTPIEVTPTGIKTGETKHPLDALVLATGYDAVTGAMMRVDITGRDGVKLRDHWGEGPRTHLGLTTAGFPNLFFVDGPGSPGAFFQPILLAEHQVRWVGEAASFVRNRNARTIEPSAAAEAEWTGHLTDVTNATLFPKANSWYMGANIPGKPRVPMMYLGGFGEYSRRTNLAVTSEFSEFLVSHTAVEQEACSELVDQQA